jgi:hypothetical protein
MSVGLKTTPAITHSVALAPPVAAASQESGNQQDSAPVGQLAAARPNLTPYKPSGWSDKIVVSNVAGTFTSPGTLTSADTLYIDWAGVNNGNAATSSRFSAQLYVDGRLKRTWTKDPPVDAGGAFTVDDFALGRLPPGKHSIQIRLDTRKSVGESNEKDNVYTKSINVVAPIRFVAKFSDAPGEGFNDPVYGAQRRAAFQYALGIWSRSLPRAYVGETITIIAYFDPLGGSWDGAMLGEGGTNNGVRANFGGRSRPNTTYSQALANHLKGSDLSPGVAEIWARFNSDVDNPDVLRSRGWYYGSDGNCGDNIDFVSVALHEIAHGLSFCSTFDSWGGGFFYDYPSIYDRFLEKGDGTDFTSMAKADRRDAVESDDLYWSGPRGSLGNGGVRPKIFAPNPSQPGSSVSHIDETLYADDLLSASYSGADHTPSAMDLGILADMGWNVSAVAASMARDTAIAVEISGSTGLALSERQGSERSAIPRSLVTSSFPKPGQQHASLSPALTGARGSELAAVDWLYWQFGRNSSDSDSQRVLAC